MAQITLITGATSGIGFEFAKIFSRHGHDLILVSRNKEKLEEVKVELENMFKNNIYIIIQDLSEVNCGKTIYDEVKKLDLKINNLVNNSGVGTFGEFKDLDINKELNMIDLNCKAVVELSSVFLNDIIEQKGRFLNVASTAAFQPIPTMSVYASTKSFVLSFSYGLDLEIRKLGASVTCLAPGATKTNFDINAGILNKKFFNDSNVMKADIVAEMGYRAMMRRKRLIVPGLRNKLFMMLTKLFSKTYSAKVAYRMVQR